MLLCSTISVFPFVFVQCGPGAECIAYSRALHTHAHTCTRTHFSEHRVGKLFELQMEPECVLASRPSLQQTSFFCAEKVRKANQKERGRVRAKVLLKGSDYLRT